MRLVDSDEEAEGKDGRQNGYEYLREMCMEIVSDIKKSGNGD